MAIQIRSIDDFVAFLIVAGECGPLWKLVDLDTLSVKIPVVIKGPDRDGRLDVWGADFLKNLQKSIRWTARELGGVSLSSRKYALRQTITKGSDESKTDYTKVIREAVRQMSGPQIMVVSIIGILCATGYFSFKNYNMSQIDAMRIQCNEQIESHRMAHNEEIIKQLNKSNRTLIREFTGALREAKDISSSMGRDSEKPIRAYIKSMRRDDSIQVDNSELFDKREAISRLDALPDKTIFSVHGDGSYVLYGVEFLGGRQTIKIGQGEEKTNAFLERLDEKIRDAILEAVEDTLDTQSEQEMNLQVDIYFTEKGVSHAVVIGVGEPRRGSYTLEDIPHDVPRRFWKRQGEPSEE